MKKSFFITLVLITAALVCRASKGDNGLEVKFKGNSMLIVSGSESKLQKVVMEPRREMGKTPREYTYVDYSRMEYYQMAILPSGDTVTTITPFEFNKNLTISRREKLLGYDCTVATTSVNSNSIEIWYAKDGVNRGTPMPAWGVPDGLVLKVVRNGNATFEAQSIEKYTSNETLLPPSWGKVMDGADYRFTLNNSVVRTVEVFDREQIGFKGGAAPDKFDQANHTYQVGGGTVILKRVTLPQDIDKHSIFAEVSQYSDGDAYDRTGSIFIVPVGKEKSYLDAMSSKGLSSVPAFVSDTLKFPALVSTPNYDVPVELMRFFTTFGVRGFNHIKVKGQNWADSVIYKSDVTYLSPMLRGEVWIGAYIGNWDSRGHRLSLKLKYHPSGRAETQKVVVPLFNTLNILEQAGQTYPTFFDKDSLRVSFDIPQQMKNVQMVYITTGHGGWGGGDEFNQKLNTIYIDGKKVFSFIPWREDCASYRNSNPASGNFANGLSSSDLSRSNWCPGTVTYPVYIPLGTINAGQHNISVQIPLGKPDGGSFSYWCISGYLIGEIDSL